MCCKLLFQKDKKRLLFTHGLEAISTDLLIGLPSLNQDPDKLIKDSLFTHLQT